MDYFFRCTEKDKENLINALCALGILKKVEIPFIQVIDDEEVQGTETIIVAQGGTTWDEIGPIPDLAKEIQEGQSHPYKQDTNGNVYWHANLYNAPNLTKLESDNLEPVLVQLGQFFLKDAQGNPRPPSHPWRVVAGWTAPQTQAALVQLDGAASPQQ